MCGMSRQSANKRVCPAHNAYCRGCRKKGNYVKCCKNKRRRESKKEVKEASPEIIFQIKGQCVDHPNNVVKVDGVVILMRFDSCSYLNIISKGRFDLMFYDKVKLRSMVVHPGDLCW